MQSEENAQINGEQTVDFCCMNAPVYQSVLVKQYFAKHNATTKEHNPYFTDLAPDDF